MKRWTVAALIIISLWNQAGLAQHLPEIMNRESSWFFLERHPMRSWSKAKGMNLGSAEATKTFLSLARNPSKSNNVDLEWAQQLGLSAAPGIDVVTDMTTNFLRRRVYVTGYSSAPTTGFDFLTICYNISGDEVWSARYDGPDGGEDMPIGVASDLDGNAYVAGISQGIDTGYDYVVVKYNSSGGEEWVARYSNDSPTIAEFPLHAADFANDMVLLGDGGTVVTGKAAENYLTVKFDANGHAAWANVFDNKSAIDEATAVTADFDGNVYVTGRSNSQITNLRTVKYDSEGRETWVSGFGSGSEGAFGADIAFDGEDGIYIVGGRFQKNFLLLKLDKNTGDNVQIIQPPGEGRLNKLVIDSGNYVYFTGYENSDDAARTDYVTFKYDATGKLQWRTLFDGGNNGYDEAHDLLVSGSDVYVTGVSTSSDAPGDQDSFLDFATVKYSGSGQQEWVQRYAGPSGDADIAEGIGMMNLLRQGIHLFVGGTSREAGSGDDFTLVKYRLDSGLPADAWVSRHDGPGANAASPSAMIVDNAGNVYVTGQIGWGEDADYLTAKYDSAGVLQWTARYDRAQKGDAPTAVAVDGGGNVYVTGKTTASGYEITTVKYDAAGQEQWVVHYVIPTNDGPHSIAVDGDGNVVVASVRGEIIKYSPSGVQQWIADAGFLSSFVMKLEDCCNIVVAGTITENSDTDMLLRKYNPEGQEEWSARYDNLSNSTSLDFDSPSDLAVDGHGNVYVTGQSTGANTGMDFATIKYDASGQQVWSARWEGPYKDVPEAIAIDGLANVYVVGTSPRSQGSLFNFDFVTVKYDSEGNEQWVKWYAGELAGSSELGGVITLDQSGNIYVGGKSGFGSSGFDSDIAIVIYDANGDEEWISRYDVPTEDYLIGLSAFGSGDVFAAGGLRTGSGSGSSNIVVLKYTQSPALSVADETANLFEGLHLSQSYPNPFNPTTTIEYELPQRAHVTLEIFNVLGKKIATLVNQRMDAGRHVVPWRARGQPSGVYYYRLRSNDFVATKKLLLMK